MIHHPDPQAIQNRLSEIRDAISTLQAEADELETALRVIERFSATKVISKQRIQVLRKKLAPAKEMAKLGPKRPAGIPSNFEMVDLILKSAEREGKDGLTANEIIEQIGKRYWPGVEAPQVTSFIYQFGRQGRIRKNANGKFESVHKDNEGPDSNEREPS